MQLELTSCMSCTKVRGLMQCQLALQHQEFTTQNAECNSLISSTLHVEGDKRSGREAFYRHSHASAFVVRPSRESARALVAWWHSREAESVGSQRHDSSTTRRPKQSSPFVSHSARNEALHHSCHGFQDRF